MNNNHNKNISDKNLGIQVLRTILCLWVVFFHCLNIKYAYKKKYAFIFTKFYHVPCFTFISFYFNANIFIQKNCKKIIIRLQRLLIPYFIYPISIWLINNLIFFIFRNNRFHRMITLYELYLQILLGYQFFIVLWFSFCTIIISIFFVIISFLLKNSYSYIFIMLGILNIFAQYLKIDNYFLNYKTKIQTPLNNTFSQIPLAVCGYFFSLLKPKQIIQNNKKSIFISFITLLLVSLIFNFDVFTRMRTFNGIENILVSFLLFIGFYLLPLKDINKKIKIILGIITSYTQGIYCLHTIVRDYTFIALNKQKSILGVIFIYLLSYMISFLGMKLLGKKKLKYLFV